jgi:hypothetical protein
MEKLDKPISYYIGDPPPSDVQLRHYHSTRLKTGKFTQLCEVAITVSVTRTGRMLAWSVGKSTPKTS